MATALVLLPLIDGALRQRHPLGGGGEVTLQLEVELEEPCVGREGRGYCFPSPVPRSPSQTPLEPPPRAHSPTSRGDTDAVTLTPWRHCRNCPIPLLAAPTLVSEGSGGLRPRAATVCGAPLEEEPPPGRGGFGEMGGQLKVPVAGQEKRRMPSADRGAASPPQALLLTGCFPQICWRDRTAGHQQPRRLLGCCLDHGLDV